MQLWVPSLSGPGLWLLRQMLWSRSVPGLPVQRDRCADRRELSPWGAGAPAWPAGRQGGAEFSATLAVRFFTRQVCVLEAGRAATLNVKRGPSAPRRCRGAARGLGSPDAVSLDDVGTASTFAQPLPRGNSEWAPEEATGRGRGKARAGNGERGIPSTQNWSFLRQGSSGVSSRECGR